MATIFTKIVNGEIPAYKVAENDRFLAFLDINPLAKGHTLVIPKRETDYILDMEDSELAELMIFAKKVGRAIERVVPCERMGITVIGLEVPHTHIDMDFKQPKLKLTSAEMEQISLAIKNELKLN